MCLWSDVSRSGFYEWRDRPDSATLQRREELALLVLDIFDDSDETYGYRRGLDEVGSQGGVGGPQVGRGLLRGEALARASRGRGGRPRCPTRPRPTRPIWSTAISPPTRQAKRWSATLPIFT